MDPSTYFAERRPLVAAAMRETLQKARTRLASISPEAPELFDRLDAFSSGGKMLRGALACLGFELYAPCGSTICGPAGAHTSSGADDTHGTSAGHESAGFANVLDLAVAMEALQSGLLIHDDIMDGDETRRGMPTIHTAYARTAAAEGVEAEKAENLGRGLGICAGDVCYFVAWDIISILPASVSSFCAKELIKVCLAQMRDVRWGNSDTLPSEEAILDMYRYKTARYTFSLPLSAGALLAGRPDACDPLERYGEAAGIVFQLRDDSLGLFGDSSEIGKPVGSDIRESKKTLQHILLRATATHEENARLSVIYGNQDIDQSDIEYVRRLTLEHGIPAKIDEIGAHYTKAAFACLDSLCLTRPAPDPDLVNLLHQFADYASTRCR